MLKRFTALIIISSFLFSCASITKMDRKAVNYIDNDRAVEDIITSKKERENPTEKKVKDDKVYIYQGTEKIGELTTDEFKSIVYASSYYEKIVEAEKKKRVYVFFKDSPWKLKPGQKVQTEMYIIWKDPKGIPLKKLALKLTMEVPKEGKAMSKIRIIYRNVAEIGFPVTLGVLVIVLGLVLGL